MSKATFLQSVLGRPSRSYSEKSYELPTPPLADPYNPYKGYATSSLPRSYSHGSYATNSDYPIDDDQPGPSRRRPVAAAAAAAAAATDLAAHPHYFPSHSASLGYGQQRVSGTSLDHRSDSSSSLGYARSDLGLGLPPGASPNAPARRGRRYVSEGSLAEQQRGRYYPDDDEPYAQYAQFPDEPPPPPPPPKPFARQVHIANAPLHEYEYDYQYDYSPPSSTVSSVRSGRSGRAPRPPPLPNFNHYDNTRWQPLTQSPLSSVPSSVIGSANEPNPNPVRRTVTFIPDKKLPPIAVPAPAMAPVIVTQSSDISDSEGEDDVFYTPRSSLDLAALDETAALDTPVSDVTVLPTFQLQPPTPMHDLATPPLERELTLRQSLLNPADAIETTSEHSGDGEEFEATSTEEGTRVTELTPSTSDVIAQKSARPRKERSKESISSTASAESIPPPVPPKSPTKSRGGRVRGASVTVLNRGNTSPTAAKSALPDSPLRRSKTAKPAKTKPTPVPKDLSQDQPRPTSRNESRNEMRAMSEVGYARRESDSDVSHSRSDGGVRAAGYGKGGWAAASAAPVVMYMPQNGNDGWAAFQPLPPRSRFSVLPGSQVPMAGYARDQSFGSGSATSSSLAPSASASQDGRRPSYNSYSSSSPRASPTIGAFPSLPFQQGRRYEPSSLSRSSSPLTSPKLPRGGSIPSLSGSPALTSPSPLDSDDSDDERPSRSYVSKSRREYDYGSEVGASRSASGSNSRAGSIVRFDASAGPVEKYEPEPSRFLPSAGYDPYADPRSAQPFVREVQQNRRASAPYPAMVEREARYPASEGDAMPMHRAESIPPTRYSPAMNKRASLPASAYAASYGSHGSDTGRRLSPSPMTMPVLRAMSPQPSLTPSQSASQRINLDRPSSINPDLLTFLPEMTAAASDALYTESESGHRRWGSDGVRRSKSLKNLARTPMSDVAISTRNKHDSLRAPSCMSTRSAVISLDGPEAGSIGVSDILMESHGRDLRGNGYTNLVLPKGGSYMPTAKPHKELTKELTRLDPRTTGMPHSSMAAITMSSSLLAYKRSDESATPAHLRHNLPPPVDFTSHVPPPTKVGDSQIMVQVYAVAIDAADVAALDDKGEADVGKWVPGRSFVGRALAVGSDEKDMQRGDLVVGLLDVRKSGALCEYIVADRRRLARAPASDLTLEQLALLPVQGITTLRALRSVVARGAAALIMDAHAGVPALMCQEMSRHGVEVIAVIPDVDPRAQAELRAAVAVNGAARVLVGSPAAALMSLSEASLHLVVDTRGGTKVQQAIKRALVPGGHALSLVRKDSNNKSPTGLSFKNVFRRNMAEKVVVAGTGEGNVDTSGLDCRDVMEEPGMEALAPVVGRVVPFERGQELFVSGPAGREVGGVVRIIN